MFELVMAILWGILFLARIFILQQNIMDDGLYLYIVIILLNLEIYLKDR